MPSRMAGLRALRESRKAAPSTGEVCAEVCLAVRHLWPSSFFTITKFSSITEAGRAALMDLIG
jgi:hypothetical protein